MTTHEQTILPSPEKCLGGNLKNGNHGPMSVTQPLLNSPLSLNLNQTFADAVAAARKYSEAMDAQDPEHEAEVVTTPPRPHKDHWLMTTHEQTILPSPEKCLGGNLKNGNHGPMSVTQLLLNSRPTQATEERLAAATAAAREFYEANQAQVPKPKTAAVTTPPNPQLEPPPAWLKNEMPVNRQQTLYDKIIQKTNAVAKWRAMSDEERDRQTAACSNQVADPSNCTTPTDAVKSTVNAPANQKPLPEVWRDVFGFWDKCIADDDPDEAIHRLAIYCHSVLGLTQESDINNVIISLELDKLFKLPIESIKATAVAKFREVVKKAKAKGRTLPVFIVTGQVKKRVPADRLRTDRQQLLHDEMAVVLKTITLRLLDAADRGQAKVTLAHNYFCNKKHAQMFRKATGRTLNLQKLREILNLLQEFELIGRSNWTDRPRGEGRRFGPTTYTWGKQSIWLPSAFRPSTLMPMLTMDIWIQPGVIKNAGG